MILNIRKIRAFCAIFIVTSCCFAYSSKNIFVAGDNKVSSSQGECVMELNSRRVLYSYRGDVRLPMASTTKIATAITALEICNNDTSKQITIPDIAEGVEGSTVYLKSGEIYTIEDLLYGLMLRSGNDCATALAVHFCGNISNFCAQMNKIAQRVGALATNFANPHGLPCKNHYTTANDLSLIACYALKNPLFKQIVSTRYYEPRHWLNKNKMLANYEGAIGVKTGYTKEAGRCLVTAAQQNNMTLVCTVLNSPMMYERTAQLLNDAFSAFSYTSLLREGEIFTIKNGKHTLKACVRDSFAYPLMKGEEQAVEVSVHPALGVMDEEIIGQIEISLAKRLLFSANLYKL